MKKAILLGVLLVGVGVGYSFSALTGDSQETINKAEAKEEAEQFINDNLIPPDSDQEAKVKNIQKENGLYKVAVEVGGQEIQSYLTPNGETFFPQAMDTDGEDSGDEGDDSSQGEEQKASVNTKKETPVVELFAMSYCPYGTQMEKAILPVVEKLGDKIDFDLQFVDYAMHDKKELDENLRQHCIEQEQPSKLTSYLDCFLMNKDAEKCMNEEGVDTSRIESCVQETDQEYKVTEKYNDKSTYKGSYPVFGVNKEANEEYNVSGSPTLVINGEKIKAARQPNALLSTICSGFQDKPEECSAQLSSQSPAPGFGAGQAGNASSGNCE